MPTAAHHRKVTERGGSLQRDLSLIKSGHYRMPASSLEDLANDPDVAHISPNREVHAHTDQADVTIGANLAASYNVNGTGVGVAIIDSGVGPSDDLTGKVVYEQQFLNGPSQDVFGHGTHVAGIIAGSGKNSTGSAYFRTFQGVAPGVTLALSPSLRAVSWAVEKGITSGNDRSDTKRVRRSCSRAWYRA